MKQWTLAAAGFALLAASLWHLPATAQRSATPDNPQSVLAPPLSDEAAADPAPGLPRSAGARPQTAAQSQAAAEPITFADYREFRLRDIARRQTRLERELAEPDLTPRRAGEPRSAQGLLRPAGLDAEGGARSAFPRPFRADRHRPRRHDRRGRARRLAGEATRALSRRRSAGPRRHRRQPALSRPAAARRANHRRRPRPARDAARAPAATTAARPKSRSASA